MILGLEIGLAIYGLIALIKGRFNISKAKAVTGVPARLLGLVCLTPLPVAIVAAMIYTAAATDVTDPQKVEQFAQDNMLTYTLIEAGVVIGIAVLIFVAAAVMARPIEEVERESRRKAREYDDGYDDRPRNRRLDEHDEEDDDRPRRKRYDD
jgi:hypothetical protein